MASCDVLYKAYSKDDKFNLKADQTFQYVQMFLD